MPIINISLTTAPDYRRSEAIATAVTDLTQRHLKKDPTITAVAIQHIDPGHWFAGGKSLASHGQQSYWLDLKVVDGTNTKPELAAYLEALFERMNELLGGVHTESYALVHEVPASAYGFGGQTQEFRYISGKLKQAQLAA
jgi:4-oxalocrotonate tautomerase